MEGPENPGGQEGSRLQFTVTRFFDTNRCLKMATKALIFPQGDSFIPKKNIQNRLTFFFQILKLVHTPPDFQSKKL